MELIFNFSYIDVILNLLLQSMKFYITGSPPSVPPYQQGYQQQYPGSPQQPYPGAYPPPQQPSYQQQPMSSPGSGIVSNCRGNKKALLIGINYYGQRGELRGCINDVNNIKRLITSRGFIEDSTHMRILTDDHRNAALHPTRRNIIEGMHWLGMHGFIDFAYDFLSVVISFDSHLNQFNIFCIKKEY